MTVPNQPATTPPATAPPATPPAAATTPPAAPPAAPPADQQQPDLGFPADTPLERMTVEQREAYWKHYARKHEKTVKDLGNVDELRAKAAELDQLRAAQMTPADRQLADARAEGEVAALARLAPTIVSSAIVAAAAAKGITIAPQVLEGLNHSFYLSNAGVPDTDKVTAFVNGLPGGTSGGNGGNNQQRWPDMGQGNRQQGGTSAAERGRLEAEKRFGKKADAPQ